MKIPKFSPQICGDPSWIPTQGIGDKLPVPSPAIGPGSGDIKPGI